VGGLVTSTVLTLVVLPTIYAAVSTALARRRARMATA
jgi:Cu/Ag efflux pump CusA